MPTATKISFTVTLTNDEWQTVVDYYMHSPEISNEALERAMGDLIDEVNSAVE